VKPTVRTLIVDIDNTLFDWVAMWSAAFTAMLRELEQRSGVARAQLLPAIRAIHQQNATSEYAYLAQDLVAQGVVRLDAAAIDAVTGAYRTARDAHLVPYPLVAETLSYAKSRGTLVVGLTESQPVYVDYRFERMGLHRLFDRVYTGPDRPLDPAKGRGFVDISTAGAHRALFVPVSGGKHKPDPELLLGVLSERGSAPPSAIYVGDSIANDVAMAQAAHVTDVHAAYGAAQGSADYELLRTVSHWTDDAIKKEATVLTGQSVIPTYVLQEHVGELLGLFSFRTASGDSAAGAPELVPLKGAPSKLVDLSLEAWKQTIAVQEHFNDLEFRVRGFALTFLSALFTVAGILWQLDRASYAPAIIVGLLGVGAVIVFYLIDQHHYHRLLQGSVEHGRRVEAFLREQTGLTVFDLTGEIKAESPIGAGKRQLHSEEKIRRFYFWVGVIVFGIAVVFAAVAFVNGIKPPPEPPPWLI
jgi:phosphoglycolate phosphatase-like HAD superfamily hydrolase